MKKLLLLAVFLAGAASVAQAADGDPVCLRLRPQTTVYGDAVTLGDVLVFASAEDELTERIANEPVSTDATRPVTEVGHDAIVRRLDELGVNMSRVLLSGALHCTITRPAPMKPAEPEAAPLLGTPAAPAAPGARTLAEVVRAYVDSELAGLGGTAEIDFERAGQEFLQLTTPPWEFGVSSSGRDKLGLREFHIVIRRDGHLQRKADLFAQVRLVRPVVIAKRPLNPGNTVRSEDVGVETRVFTDSGHRGPSRVEEVVGQQIKSFVPTGEALKADALKAVDLVVRSRPVTVTNESSAVQVRLTGVALDSGGYGDTVRIRMGDTRGERQMLRGVVTGLGTVRLAEGSL